MLLQMLTSSQERFEAILKEAPKELKRYLVRVTKYQAGINCKVRNQLLYVLSPHAFTRSSFP